MKDKVLTLIKSYLEDLENQHSKWWQLEFEDSAYYWKQEILWDLERIISSDWF